MTFNNELLNAADARRQVEQGTYQKAAKQMAMIVQLINKAIQDGKMLVSLDEVRLEPSVKQQLEHKGYLVKFDSFRNEQLTTISW